MILAIAVSGMVLLGLIVWFNALEGRNQRHVIFVVLAITLVVEALLAGPASEVPVGILRPRIIRQDFRPPDAVIVAALIARTLQFRGRSFPRLGLFWFGFITLYVAGVGVGLLSGLPVIEVLFQGKAAFYLVGGMTIAAGADVRRLADSIAKLAVVLGFMVPIAFVIDAARIDLSLSTPVQRFNRLGNLSNDTVTLLTLIGAVALISEVTREDRRFKVALASLALLFAPLVGRQRASYLVVLAIAIVFVILIAGSTWRKRSGATGVEIGLFAIGLIGLAIAGVALTSSPAAILEPVTDTFGGDANARSADSRVSLYNQALSKIQDDPIVGSGVGTKVVRVAALNASKEVDAAAHNVLLDVALRIGLVGLGVYLIALWSTAATALRLWRAAVDDRVAAMAVGGLMVVAGTFAKGLVEPALDKFRLSLAMGIGVGLVMAAVRGDEVTESASDEAPAYMTKS
ncbi:MAG: O-antigen ligase family protein [Ilumatobacter sp.]